MKTKAKVMGVLRIYFQQIPTATTKIEEITSGLLWTVLLKKSKLND